MTQIILFDVDGVLINGYHAKEEMRVYWDKDLETDLGIKRADFVTLFATPSWGDVIVGKKHLKDALEEFLPSIGCTVPAGDVISYWLKKDSNINVPVLNVIKKLSNREDTQLFIATNQEHNRAEYLMQNLGFADYFEGIFYSAQIGATKTNPDYYKQVDRLLGTTKSKPIFFDDTIEVVNAANTHGWQAYEFYNMDSLEQSEFVRDVASSL